MTSGLFTCAACMRRALQGVSRAKAFPISPLAASRQVVQPFLRHYAATQSVQATTDSVESEALQSLNVSETETSTSQKRERGRLERVVNKELEYLADPYKIAEHINRILKRDRFDEALLLTQKASKDRQVVVAWNHLIDYTLEKQQLRKAIKLYNDMKKRAQLPNVQTYTIIFRGCARSQFYGQAVEVAIKHYNMLLQDTRLQPNTTHLNAVLNVCAKAGDLDSMFLMADTINDAARAPTAYTYTTILHALQAHGIKDRNAKDLSQPQREANVNKTIERAKGLWMEVIDKWNQGQLVIDEPLVCAMGRVLLLSFKLESRREVLDLLEQTMGIPNMGKILDSKTNGNSGTYAMPVSNDAKVVRRSGSVYAVPGRNALALVIQTLAMTRMTSKGIQYWNLMLERYAIVPDNDIWLRMFGLLKAGKSSGQAANLLDLLPADYGFETPFKLAMEACLQDNLNPNAITNSDLVLDSMMARLKTPDLQTLRLYLRLALISNLQYRNMAKSGEENEAKRLYGLQITKALSRLWGPYQKVYKSSFDMTQHADKQTEGALYNDQREVIALARVMYSAFAKVIEEKMLPEEELRPLRPLGARINRGITDFFAVREAREPNLPSAREKREQSDRQDQSRFEAATTTVSDGWDAIEGPSRAFVWDTARMDKLKARNSREQRIR